MRIISKKKIKEFCETHPAAEPALLEWYRKTKAASWRTIADVKRTFPHADAVGTCTVFNAGGNSYRIITKIAYEFYTVYIRAILLHSDYDKGDWKRDCKK